MITKHFRADYKFWKMYDSAMIDQFKRDHGNKPKLRVRKMAEWKIDPMKTFTCFGQINTDITDLVDDEEF